MPKTQDDQDKQTKDNLFGKNFSLKEQKQLFLQLVIGIVLAELALGVGAVIYSITNAKAGPDKIPQFQFPWLGYMISALVLPVLILLITHLVQSTISRPTEGYGDAHISERVKHFYDLVHSAPTIILLVAMALLAIAVYYLDGVMNLLLKISEHFGEIAIWLICGLTVAWVVSYAVRAILHYKTQQMQQEYTFRREVLERTGMVLLDAKHSPVTDARILDPATLLDVKALPEGTGESSQNDDPDVIDAEIKEEKNPEKKTKDSLIKKRPSHSHDLE